MENTPFLRLDLGPELTGPVFEPLRDLKQLKRFRVDPAFHTLKGNDKGSGIFYQESLVSCRQPLPAGVRGTSYP